MQLLIFISEYVNLFSTPLGSFRSVPTQIIMLPYHIPLNHAKISKYLKGGGEFEDLNLFLYT